MKKKKLETAFHNRSGEFHPGNTVKIIGTAEIGIVVSLSHSKTFGVGRIIAKVLMLDGRIKEYPLGNLRR